MKNVTTDNVFLNNIEKNSHGLQWISGKCKKTRTRNKGRVVLVTYSVNMQADAQKNSTRFQNKKIIKGERGGEVV